MIDEKSAKCCNVNEDMDEEARGDSAVFGTLNIGAFTFNPVAGFNASDIISDWLSGQWSEVGMKVIPIWLIGREEYKRFLSHSHNPLHAPRKPSQRQKALKTDLHFASPLLKL